MNIRTKAFVGLTFACTLGAAAANAQTPPPLEGTLTQNPETGHYYQVFGLNNIPWGTADGNALAAECLNRLDPEGPTVDCITNPNAIKPHLATITSAREEAFVDVLRNLELNGGMLNDVTFSGTVLSQSQTWIGGFQTGTSEPGDGWQWSNGEGNFPGNNGGVIYTNWNAAEPNNSGGNEDHLTLGRYGLGGGWNDEGAAIYSIGGYIVEWDVPRALEDCETSAGGCVTIEGHTLQFPENSGLSQTLSFNSFEINDPRVNLVPGPNFLTCDNVNAGLAPGLPLEIFGGSGIGSPPNPADPGYRNPMLIPAYLCGSPKFVVVAVDTGPTNLLSGTVFVENDTETVLPDNMYADGSSNVCEDPIVQVQYSDGDPQYQDVVVWQTTDPTRMLENDLGGGAGYLGAAGEFTDECGSSKARVRGASYYGIGFHIDFGIGNDWENFPENNFSSFVALTRYKLTLLQESLADAIADNTVGDSAIIKKADRKKMTNQVANAIKNLDDGNYSGALDHVENFLKFVLPANYRIVPGENYEGEHLMRGSNIEFMLRVKVIPYAPQVLP